jgi:hypothetical protein
MDRDTFFKAYALYRETELIKEKSQKLFELKGIVVKILEGHIEIPEEEIFKLFAQLDILIKHLDTGIDKKWEQIHNL